MSGSAYFDRHRAAMIAPQHAVLYEKNGDQVSIVTADRSARFLFLSGKPLNEPVAWGGPIVMNSQEELRIAFEEYRQGTFVK
jgi:redox-sensitive bicupin YhaK (pirin superfamily)